MTANGHSSHRTLLQVSRAYNAKRGASAFALLVFLGTAIPLLCDADPLVSANSNVIYFDQTSGTSSQLIFIARNGRQATLLFDKTASVAVRTEANSSVAIVIKNENDVLFSYTAKDKKLAPVPDVAAAAALSDPLQGLATALGGSTPKAFTTIPPTPPAGRPAAASKGAVTGVTINGLLVYQSAPSNSDISHRVAGAVALLSSLKADAGDLIDQTLTVSTLSAAKQTAGADEMKLSLEKIPDMLKEIDDALSKVVAGTITYSYTFENGTDSGTAHSISELDAALGADHASGQEAIQVLANMKLYSAQISDQLTLLSSLYTTIAGITDSAPIATLSYDSANDQQQPIQVQANTKFASLLSPKSQAFQKEHIGIYTITVAPYALVHLRPSIGTLYSFVHSPKYGTAYDATGALKITGTTSDYAAISGVIAIDIVPDSFFNQGTELFGQVGVAASSNYGVLVGIGIKAYKDFEITAGVVYQQVDELSSGLTVGQTLTAASNLKTDKVFKAGLYIGLGVKLK